MIMEFSEWLICENLRQIPEYLSPLSKEAFKTNGILSFSATPEGWVCVNAIDTKYGYFLDSKNNKIIINDEKAEYDPHTTAFLKMLAKLGTLNNFNVFINGKIFGKLPETLGKVKEIIGQYQTWGKEQKRVSNKRFGLRVLKTIQEDTWYHATLKERLPSILKDGLIPSREDGMGSYNNSKISIQKVIYLTSNENDAVENCKFLMGEYEDDSVIIKVAGEALSDYSKIVIDEDVLSNDQNPNYVGDDLEGITHPKGYYPHFMTSYLSIESIGYKGVIAPEFLTIHKEMLDR